MGLIKLKVDVVGLTSMILDDTPDRKYELNSDESLTADCKIVAFDIENKDLVIILSSPNLPELKEDLPELPESSAIGTAVDGPDNNTQEYVERAGQELENIFRLNQLARGLTIEEFSKRFAYLAQRCLAVQRGENPEELVQPEGYSEEKIETSNNQPG